MMAGALGILIAHWGLQLLIAIGAERHSPPRAGVARPERPALLRRGVDRDGRAVRHPPGGAALAIEPGPGAARRHAGAGSRNRTRKVLVVAEVAMALVLLVAAGLLARSFHGLQQIDVGFDPHNVLTMRVSLSGAKYREPAAVAAYFEEAARADRCGPRASARRRPSWRCRSAAAASTWAAASSARACRIRPRATTPDSRWSRPATSRRWGSTLLQGRDFDARDTATAAAGGGREPHARAAVLRRREPDRPEDPRLEGRAGRRAKSSAWSAISSRRI